MNILLIGITILCVLMTIKNIISFIKLRKNKYYAKAYTGMLKEEENVYENICQYLEKETSLELKTKVNIVKVYLEEKQDKDSSETLRDIKFDSVILNKNGNTKGMLERNSDIFIWLIYDLVIFHSKEKYYEIEKLYNIVKERDELLKECLEYAVFIAVYNTLKKDYVVDKFLKDLINGDYEGYTYNKNIIGIYKRIAETILYYRNEELEESDIEDLRVFSKTLVGKKIMSDLKLTEKLNVSEIIKE